MSKLFVRERSHVGEGAGRPRFAIVAVIGSDLKVFHTHVRKAELEKLAAEIQAEIVYLPRGEQPADKNHESGGHGRRQHRHAGPNE